MSGVRKTAGRARAAVGGVALVALLSGSLVTPASAAPIAECPDVVPVADVPVGTVGQGLTVVKGNTPSPFAVEVLGVIEDGIGAGRDMVMIKVSDLPGQHVIDQGGGIWAGMSGSPVYVNGKLLGAVAYGFTLAPSPIGGLTPAEDMDDLLALKGSAAARKAAPVATKVSLPAATKKRLAAAAGAATPSGSLEQLPTPLAVSGMRATRLKRFQADATSAGLPVRAYASGRATAAAAPSVRPQAGGNFGAILSYGDITAGGVGTTTLVCGNQALAFGHPFTLGGPVTYGATDANALAIVQDSTLGSFKMANLTGSFGTLDQDRTAGIRADLTRVPTGTTVATRVRNFDTGKVRTASTKVVARELLPGLAPYAVLANYDSTFDEVGGGRLRATWTITGHRSGGKTFSVSRTDKWANREDVAYGPAAALGEATDALLNNEFEDVTIDTITYESPISTTVKQLAVSKVEVLVGGKWTAPRTVSVKAGAKLQVRTTVTPYRSTRGTRVLSTITVPKSAKGQFGQLVVAGGGDLGQSEADLACLLAGECKSDTSVSSLDQVIRGLATAPRQDDLVTQLQLTSEDEEESGSGTAVAASVKKRQAEVVRGQRTVTVQVR